MVTFPHIAILSNSIGRPSLPWRRCGIPPTACRSSAPSAASIGVSGTGLFTPILLRERAVRQDVRCGRCGGRSDCVLDDGGGVDVISNAAGDLDAFAHNVPRSRVLPFSNARRSARKRRRAALCGAFGGRALRRSFAPNGSVIRSGPSFHLTTENVRNWISSLATTSATLSTK
jgi:hypothetical protein